MRRHPWVYVRGRTTEPNGAPVRVPNLCSETSFWNTQNGPGPFYRSACGYNANEVTGNFDPTQTSRAIITFHNGRMLTLPGAAGTEEYNNEIDQTAKSISKLNLSSNSSDWHNVTNPFPFQSQLTPNDQQRLLADRADGEFTTAGVVQTDSYGRLFIATGPEKTCLLSKKHGEPENAAWPFAGSCSAIADTLNADTPLGFTTPVGYSQTYIAFLFPQNVTQAEIKTCNGTSHPLPIINNTGTLLLHDDGYTCPYDKPRLKWHTSDGHSHDAILSERSS